MQWHELKQKQDAPESGWILAYTRNEVIFHSYQSKEELNSELADKELLELHLFDKNREYRCLSTRSKRFADGMIEAIADFDEREADSIYKECILLSKEWKEKEITVLNHIKYQEENGMAVIDNYRLKI